MPAPKKPVRQRRSRAHNKQATTLNIPCFKPEKQAWKDAAGETPVATWARQILNEKAARPPDSPPS